jgi:hypothetical protein
MAGPVQRLFRLRATAKTRTLTIATWLATTFNRRTRWLAQRPISQLNTWTLRTRFLLIDVTWTLSHRRTLALLVT